MQDQIDFVSIIRLDHSFDATPFSKESERFVSDELDAVLILSECLEKDNSG